MKKLIERSYLNDLIKTIGTPDIKVITGVRRSGKSVLLGQFTDYIINNVDNFNLIRIDFNSLEFDSIRTYLEMNNYIETRYVDGAHNFVLIDEVQMCEGFEKTINSLHNSGKYDIFITGSNAFLQSSDLATLFVGRAFPVEVFPFSFKEFLEFSEESDIQSGFERYLKIGGFSGAYLYPDEKHRYDYINEIFETLIIRDIQKKNKIKDITTFTKVCDYLIDNISNLTTARAITNTLNSSGVNISHSTIDLYLKYLCEAFAFYKIKRFDVKGRGYLRTQDKYYLCDHAIKYARLGTKRMDRGQALENIVCIELLRRGYEVYVGTVGEREVDFIAKRRNEQFYVQVCYDLSNRETMEREARSLLEISDAYPKLILAGTKQEEQDYNGVRIIDVAEWLAEE